MTNVCFSEKVMLTVFKANRGAMAFYTNPKGGLAYAIDKTSPSNFKVLSCAGCLLDCRRYKKNKLVPVRANSLIATFISSSTWLLFEAATSLSPPIFTAEHSCTRAHTPRGATW